MPFHVLRPCGAGWSSDKEESQCKAVTEAVERWAFRYCSKHSPAEADLDVNPTTDGFAALPATLGEERLFIHAYCEALERWGLSRLWDHGDIAFRRVRPHNDQVLKLFARFPGQLHCFEAIVKLDRSNQTLATQLVFCLCVFETPTGGAIPGSACGAHSQIALERAMLEAYVHVRAFARMKDCNVESFENMIEKRLCFFGNQTRGYAMVKERIQETASPGPINPPDIAFSKRLDGPWNPEVLVHRVMISGDSRAANDAALERFLI
ncbi:MAG: hypothetical protein A2X40_06700 [Elusimicrobia bacterium GWC2_65_9]|nr:MAG: hypothetical protein A2X40_06700 [Elusimicrobia bacterium GWC2_65_9]